REGMVVGLANHTVLTAKDGRVTPIDDAASPIKTADGKIMGAVLIFRDVTARRRAEEKFRVAVEAAPTAIMLVDHDGLIQLVNGLTEQLLGYTRSELIGQSVEQFVPLRFRGHHSEYRTNFFKYPGRRPMGAGRDLYALRKDG